MIYNNIKTAKFLARPNRFIAHIELDGKIEICHVKNTGRCKELLVEDARIMVQEFDSTMRKTKYDLICVYKEGRLINMDSQVPNKVVGEWLQRGGLFKDVVLIKPESKYKNSRFDFYVETTKEKIYIEVKGVTLEEDNISMFPDAPTERGVKHLRELAECIEDGFSAYVIFVIQMKGISQFVPNARTHKAFADMLKEVKAKGVNVLAYDCKVTEDSIEINNAVPILV